MRPLSLSHILVATDLETLPHAAVQSARHLAELSGAELHVVHAAVPPTTDAELETRLDALKSSLQVEGVTLLSGPPGANITEEAVRTDADVIVLGGHRNRSTGLGSTADRVVRNARVSCLILPDSLALPLGTVLVPVDIATDGPLDIALTWASALRRRDSDSPTRVIALHVQAGAITDGARAQLGAAVERANREYGHSAGVEIEDRIVSGDDVPRVILAQAEAENADLIVIGTRAERLEAAPLGSVSSAVAMQAHTPVLLVPPEIWRNDSATP